MDNDSCEIQEENYVCYDLELAWLLDIYMENWAMRQDASALMSFLFIFLCTTTIRVDSDEVTFTPTVNWIQYP